MANPGAFTTLQDCFTLPAKDTLVLPLRPSPDRQEHSRPLPRALLPDLLNEVHLLIEKHRCHFILSGSSARKLRRGGANLLAGRAVERFLFPFVYAEIASSFDLEAALRFGTLPAIHERPQTEQIDILGTYANTYLREEIQQEGLVRNLGGFLRFLDLASAQCGELVNFSAFGRECGLPTRTVQAYYDILEDTLIGCRLEPWTRSARKRLVAHQKFYLFDTGVANAVNRRLTAPPDSALRGRLFEQLMVLETLRMRSYLRSEARLFFWRTNAGAEVDLLIPRCRSRSSATRPSRTSSKGFACCHGESISRSFRKSWVEPATRRRDGATVRRLTGGEMCTIMV